MITDDIGRPNGNCKPSGYAEYDALTGYVTRTYQTEWTDTSGNLWRKTCTIINLGRPDRGVPVDHEAQIRDEVWVDEAQQQDDQRRRDSAIERNRVQRHRVAMESLVAYMQAHGPSPLTELLDVTDWAGKTQLVEHFEMFPDVYLRYWDRPRVWGLHGQSYKHRHEDRPVSARIMDALTEHGPLTLKELEAVTGASRNGINRQLKENAHWFARVAHREQQRQGPAPETWGLVEVTA
jgi:hypothetical protein